MAEGEDILTWQKVELCTYCGEPTGFAGKGEDSLYLDNLGPWCQECYEVARYAYNHAIDIAKNATKQIHEQQRERVKKLKGELAICCYEFEALLEMFPQTANILLTRIAVIRSLGIAELEATDA